MSTTKNSTLEKDSTSEADNVKYIVIIVPVALALVTVIVLVFALRACWRKRRGSRQYRRVPTKDTPDHPQNERVKRKVRIIMPDPPPIKTSIAIATDIAMGNSKLPHYLPHKLPAKSKSRGGEETPSGMVGVAASQAFLYLKVCVHHNRLMVEVQNAVDLPCRADGTPVNPFVKLRMASRESKSISRKSSSSTQLVPVDPEYMQRVDCGSVAREELENCILHVEVLDHWSHSRDVVIAVADVTLNQVKDTKSFKVSLNIVKHPPITFTGHALISLYNDKVSSKLSVTIPKVELLMDNPSSSTDYWIKVVITRGEKCLVKEKVKHTSISSDEIHFNKSIACHFNDISSLSVQCSLMATVNFMRRPKLLGTVKLGSHVQGQALRHWNDMLNSPNTHIAEWHDLT